MVNDIFFTFFSMELSKLKLNVGALNVNSFNVSTIGIRNSKTFLKVEGATQLKLDIIFLVDCRLKDKQHEVGRMFGLNRNASYKLYVNSNKESRGVAIAIKQNIVHEILETYCTIDQNILLLKARVRGVDVALGAVYGPNANDPECFNNLRRAIETWNIPYIVGGGFQYRAGQRGWRA